TTHLIPVSLHDALPISTGARQGTTSSTPRGRRCAPHLVWATHRPPATPAAADPLNARTSRSWPQSPRPDRRLNLPQCYRPRSTRSEEHTSELQSRENLV